MGGRERSTPTDTMTGELEKERRWWVGWGCGRQGERSTPTDTMTGELEKERRWWVGWGCGRQGEIHTNRHYDR